MHLQYIVLVDAKSVPTHRTSQLFGDPCCHLCVKLFREGAILVKRLAVPLFGFGTYPLFSFNRRKSEGCRNKTEVAKNE